MKAAHMRTMTFHSRKNIPALSGAPSPSGFTLLEVMIYLMIIGILIMPIISLVLTSSRFVQELDSSGKIMERNRSVLHRVETELREAIRTSIVISNPERRIIFRQASGYDGNAIVPGDEIAFRFRITDDEIWNGKDDNGNGIIDDGILIRRNRTTGEQLILCSGIDMQNSGFVLNGDAVTVTLSNTGFISRGNTTWTVTSSLDVYPYN